MGRRKRHARATVPDAAGEPRISQERAEALRKRRQKVLITWGFVGAALILLAILLLELLPKPSPYAAFATCLTKNGAVMYGTDWCSHCQAQKRMFGTAFKEMVFVNCDYSKACEAKNVTGYPTWILADGTRLEGEQPLGLLAEKTGCALPGT